MNINLILSGFVAFDAWKGSLPSKQAHALGVSLLLTALATGATSCATVARRSGRRTTRSVVSPVRILRRATIDVTLVLGSFKIHGSRARLLRFQRSLLGCTAGNRIETGASKQVLEVITRSEEDADTRDVLFRERLAVFRSLATQRQPKAAEVIQHDFLPLQQLFHEAAAHVRQHAFHLPALVTAVFGDVRHKLTEVHHFFHLRLGVSLRGLTLVHLIGEHVNTVIDHTFAHRRYGTWYLRKQLIAPDRGCYHRTALQNYNAG